MLKIRFASMLSRGGGLSIFIVAFSIVARRRIFRAPTSAEFAGVMRARAGAGSWPDQVAWILVAFVSCHVVLACLHKEMG